MKYWDADDDSYDADEDGDDEDDDEDFNTWAACLYC